MTAARSARWASLVIAGLAGAGFGAGLVIAGMTQPRKILAFLDPLSGWDPSLALVMASAAGVYALAFHARARRAAPPWFARQLHLPTRADLDAKLVVGAAVFGVGWGLGGLCPGPGLVAAAGGSGSAMQFVAAMLVGMWLQHRGLTLPGRRDVAA